MPHRPVPGIARQPQRFSAPPPPQAWTSTLPQMPQPQPDYGIDPELALEIYARLVVRETQLQPPELQKLAQYARLAAAAFYQDQSSD